MHKESTVYIELPKLISKSESEKRGECQILELQLVQPSHGLSCIGATTELTPFLFETLIFQSRTNPIYLHVCVSFEHHFHILRSTCFCFVVIVVLYLPLHILVSGCSNLHATFHT